MFLVGVMALELRDQIPLLRSRHQAHVAVGGDAFAMENELHGGVLLVDEDGVESVVVEHHVEALRVQIAAVSHLHHEIRAESGQTKSQDGDKNGLRSNEHELREHKETGLSGNSEC